MFLTRCDICGRILEEKENRYHGTFEVPPNKGDTSYYAGKYSLDICDDDLTFFLERFHKFIEGVKHARR